MNDNQHDLKDKIKEIEESMQLPEFWNDKIKAQSLVKELASLKEELSGVGKYDKGNAILSIISGAGGDDAEDFSRILLEIYLKYFKKNKWETVLIHENKNEHGGYRNITLEISGKGVYGKLKNENGVHRLVRVSPFNANSKRHTSFSLVEVLPKLSKLDEKHFIIPENDLKIEFSRSSGPGGQNVNKRETAVRILHIPTGISVHSSNQRSQEQNREQAYAMLRAKIFRIAEKEHKTLEESMKKSKAGEIEWGNQIRSYVFHPYKMVKDHRTNAETARVDEVLNGEIDLFIEAERDL